MVTNITKGQEGTSHQTKIWLTSLLTGSFQMWKWVCVYALCPNGGQLGQPALREHAHSLILDILATLFMWRSEGGRSGGYGRFIPIDKHGHKTWFAWQHRNSLGWQTGLLSSHKNSSPLHLYASSPPSPVYYVCALCVCVSSAWGALVGMLNSSAIG